MAGEEEVDIPDTGAVFTFGRSRFAENVPSHFFIRNDPVVELSCGDEHTALVCQRGRVFVFGNNDYGQLGLGHREVMTKPSCVKTLKPERAVHVACGRAHTLVSTESGKLFAWGSNSDAQLGVGDMEDRMLPTQVLDYEGEDIRQLVAGCHHSVVLTESGRVYVWGSNTDGQLGLTNISNHAVIPTLMPFDQPIAHISCGYYHTAFVTVDGSLYTCGEGENGKLGLPNSVTNCTSPMQVILGAPVRSVTCGGNHTMALTAAGKVVAFGNNFNGQLGIGADVQQSILPAGLPSMDALFIVDIACGENHTAFTTDKGHLYMCGEGRHGKLCNEDIDMSKQSLPACVTRFIGYSVEKVACGGCHTMVMATVRVGNNDDELDNISQSNISESVDSLLASARGTLPPLQHTPSLNNNMDTESAGPGEEEEDQMSTQVEHLSSNSKLDLMDNDETGDENGNDETETVSRFVFANDEEDVGNFSDGTENLDDPGETEDDIRKADSPDEKKSDDDEKDNDDVKMESEEKKQGRMARFFSNFRRKKPASAQSTRTEIVKKEVGEGEDLELPERQRSMSLGGDAGEDNKRGDSGKSKSSTGNHRKSKTCTII